MGKDRSHSRKWAKGYNKGWNTAVSVANGALKDEVAQLTADLESAIWFRDDISRNRDAWAAECHQVSRELRAMEAKLTDAKAKNERLIEENERLEADSQNFERIVRLQADEIKTLCYRIDALGVSNLYLENQANALTEQLHRAEEAAHATATAAIEEIELDSDDSWMNDMVYVHRHDFPEGIEGFSLSLTEDTDWFSVHPPLGSEPDYLDDFYPEYVTTVEEWEGAPIGTRIAGPEGIAFWEKMFDGLWVFSPDDDNPYAPRFRGAEMKGIGRRKVLRRGFGS